MLFHMSGLLSEFQSLELYSTHLSEFRKVNTVLGKSFEI